MYPNKLMQINVNTTAPPNVTFGLNKVSINVTGDVLAYVLQSSDQLTYLFTLGTVSTKTFSSTHKYETLYEPLYSIFDLLSSM